MMPSVFSYVNRRVTSDEYDDLKVGYSCRQMSPGFTLPAEMDKERCYFFEKEEWGSSMVEEEEQQLQTAGMDMERVAGMDMERVAVLLKSAMEDQEKKQKVELEDQLQGFKKTLQDEFKQSEQKLKDDQQKLKDDQQKVKDDLLKLRDEVRLEQQKVSRLEVYERADTCQMVATCDVIQFVVNQLSWKLRRLISREIYGQKTATREDLFGPGKCFQSWNTVTYGKLTRDLISDWMKTHPGSSMLDYWRFLGYPGHSLGEPKVDDEQEQEEERDTAGISGYLNKAEELVAAELGINKQRLRLLCGVYVTCLRQGRNKNVHVFAMHDPIWRCNVRPDQEVQVPPLVPVTNLKTAAQAPSIKVFDLWLLRTKLGVLRMVVSDSELPRLGEYFQLFRAEIQTVGRSIQAAIGKSAGLAILKMRKGAVGEQVMTGSTLCWTSTGVRDSRTGTEFTIDSDGVWRRSGDGAAVDPTLSNLFEE